MLIQGGEVLGLSSLPFILTQRAASQTTSCSLASAGLVVTLETTASTNCKPIIYLLIFETVSGYAAHTSFELPNSLL